MREIARLEWRLTGLVLRRGPRLEEGPVPADRPGLTYGMRSISTPSAS